MCVRMVACVQVLLRAAVYGPQVDMTALGHSTATFDDYLYRM